MRDMKLPSWLEGANHITALKKAFGAWWNQVEFWMNLPLQNLDALTCDDFVLQLLAWQRDINRFENEPDSLYRNRVHFAPVNLINAGSKEGLFRIFDNLDIELVDTLERQTGVDWDIIFLRVVDSSMTSKPELMSFIIDAYGRTCRRYSYLIVDRVSMLTVVINADWQHTTDVATI